jgi:hypothetical protein
VNPVQGISDSDLAATSECPDRGSQGCRRSFRAKNSSGSRAWSAGGCKSPRPCPGGTAPSCSATRMETPSISLPRHRGRDQEVPVADGRNQSRRWLGGCRCKYGERGSHRSRTPRSPKVGNTWDSGCGTPILNRRAPYAMRMHAAVTSYFVRSVTRRVRSAPEPPPPTGAPLVILGLSSVDPSRLASAPRWTEALSTPTPVGSPVT